MERSGGLHVKKVLPDGIGSQLGIRAGNRILSINGCDLKDEIDYRFLLSTREVRIRILDEERGTREARLRKDWDQGLGLEFEPFSIRSCNNRCLFCFVDQMPPGLRSSLYFKDEDYRLSFLHGNYVTLTNLSFRDEARIVRQRLSPLFISVHATDLGLRRFLLGNPTAPDIMHQLRRLAGAHIRMHLQVVICPGLNDGPSLEKTIQDLATLQPYAQSLSLVPVGLTAHRKGLHPLRPMTPAEAGEIVKLSERYRAQFRRSGGSYFLHLSDEFYLLSQGSFPPVRTYEGFPQLENGVGFSQRFLTEFKKREKSLPGSLKQERSCLIMTAKMASNVLRPIVDRLNEIRNLRIDLIPVENSLFGPHVTVAGLLTGRDFGESMKKIEAEVEVLIPRSPLRDGDEVFLDDLSLSELMAGGRRKIVAVENRAASLLHVLMKAERQ